MGYLLTDLGGPQAQSQGELGPLVVLVRLPGYPSTTEDLPACFREETLLS
jgi:hypothetical protein